MRTNIEIDDDLMNKVLHFGHYKTKKDAVEAGLTLLKERSAQLELLKWKGNVSFFDDVDKKYIIEESEISFAAEV